MEEVSRSHLIVSSLSALLSIFYSTSTSKQLSHTSQSKHFHPSHFSTIPQTSHRTALSYRIALSPHHIKPRSLVESKCKPH